MVYDQYGEVGMASMVSMGSTARMVSMVSTAVMVYA